MGPTSNVNVTLNHSLTNIPNTRTVSTSAARNADKHVTSLTTDKRVSLVVPMSGKHVQGEHKVFPRLQTLVTRKLRGIQIYFFLPLLNLLEPELFFLILTHPVHKM